MEELLNKPEQLKEIKKIEIIVNNVRVALNQYYNKMSSNSVYLTNCNTDQDKLANVIKKLQHLSSSISKNEN